MVSDTRLSVIIPARNAAYYLAHSLPALKVGWRDDYELIVVDDASGDGTADIAREAGAKVVRLLQHEGPSAARNAGVAASTGEVLVFIDADVVVQADTVRGLQQTLEVRPEVAAVFGSYDDDPADQHLVSTFKNLMHHYVHQQGSESATTFWTGCSAIRRQAYDAAGPFRPVSLTCVEDIDYGHRLRDAGYNILLLRHIQVKHLKRWTLWGLIRTDVMERGIPWTVMMLRRGKLDSDLNLGWIHRFSTVFALAIGLGLMVKIAGFVDPTLRPNVILDAGLIVSLFCFLMLQWKFYRFLGRQRGFWFTVASVPLHLLYYLYSASALVLGVMVFAFTRASGDATRCRLKN